MRKRLTWTYEPARPDVSIRREPEVSLILLIGLTARGVEWLQQASAPDYWQHPCLFCPYQTGETLIRRLTGDGLYIKHV